MAPRGRRPRAIQAAYRKRPCAARVVAACSRWPTRSCSSLGGRKQPAYASRPERQDAHASRGLCLALQVPHDEEPRQDEENVNPEVAARQHIGPEVVDDDRRHRESAEGLDLRAEA